MEENIHKIYKLLSKDLCEDIYKTYNSIVRRKQCF